MFQETLEKRVRDVVLADLLTPASPESRFSEKYGLDLGEPQLQYTVPSQSQSRCQASSTGPTQTKRLISMGLGPSPSPSPSPLVPKQGLVGDVPANVGLGQVAPGAMIT